MCSISIYNVPPLLSFFHFTHFLPLHVKIISIGLSFFPSYLLFSDRTQHSSPTPFSCHLYPTSKVTEHQDHNNAIVTYNSADVRLDQEGEWQMLWENCAAADWDKASRHSEALNSRSDRSNCSDGVTFASTVDLHLLCYQAEFTGTPNAKQAVWRLHF